jgi:hypothetical protein
MDMGIIIKGTGIMTICITEIKPLKRRKLKDNF